MLATAATAPATAATIVHVSTRRYRRVSSLWMAASCSRSHCSINPLVGQGGRSPIGGTGCSGWRGSMRSPSLGPFTKIRLRENRLRRAECQLRMGDHRESSSGSSFHPGFELRSGRTTWSGHHRSVPLPKGRGPLRRNRAAKPNDSHQSMRIALHPRRSHGGSVLQFECSYGLDRPGTLARA
jgi:hypothetical protein